MNLSLIKKIYYNEMLRIKKLELEMCENNITRTKSQAHLLNAEIRELEKSQEVLKDEIAELSEKLGVKQNDE